MAQMADQIQSLQDEQRKLMAANAATFTTNGVAPTTTVTQSWLRQQKELVPEASRVVARQIDDDSL